MSVASPEVHDLCDFLRKSGLREDEAAYAEIADVELKEKNHIEVRIKPCNHCAQCVKNGGFFYPKKQKERSVEIPDDLVKMLRARAARSPQDRYLFPNGEGNPEGHFLRRVRDAAFKAGLNCGECNSDVNGKVVSCEDDAVCKTWGIHKFRKTFATTHFLKNPDIQQIKEWLGHERVETTWGYIGKALRSKAAMRKIVNSAFVELDAAHEQEAAAATV
jgi:integrase/recombinase XerD